MIRFVRCVNARVGGRGWSPQSSGWRTRPSRDASRGVVSRGCRLASAREVRRFEWPWPGELPQIDTKRLARFSLPGHKLTGDRYRSNQERRQRVGWEFCHSIIDDHPRLAYTEIHPGEKAPKVTAFVARALAFYAAHSIQAKRLQTENAWCYIHNRRLAELLATHALAHRRILPRTPKRMARLSATSKPSPESGPTGSAIATQRPEPTRCPSGSTITITRNPRLPLKPAPISRVRKRPKHNA
jgi:hypothetical protein